MHPCILFPFIFITNREIYYLENMGAIFKYKFERFDVEFFAIPIANFRIETYPKSNNSCSEIRTNDQASPANGISNLAAMAYIFLTQHFFLANTCFRRIEQRKYIRINH